ncbi:MAG: hypothetical protein ACRYFS_20200 [Janthinobacterium lividum]
MALLQKEIDAALQTKHEPASSNQSVPANANGQDELLWDAAIANSIDAIRELADKARTERRDGRTKKITH